MPDITNPQAVRFCNERVRPTADRIGKLYNSIIAIANEYTAQGIAALIPNTADQVADGAVSDGRPIITGADVANIIAIAASLRTTLEATGNAKLNQVLRVAVNPLP